MPGVIHFEIPADDMERAISFYRDVFGWKIDRWSDSYRPVHTNGRQHDPGINGALMARGQSVRSVCNTVDVPSVDDFVEKIESAGGRCVEPKRHVEDVGYLAYCQDTEGNLFGIMEYERS